MRPDDVGQHRSVRSSSNERRTTGILNDRDRSRGEPIDLTGSDDEDEDEDLKLAIALSLQEQPSPQTSAPEPSASTKYQMSVTANAKGDHTAAVRQDAEQPSSRTSAGVLGLDRKQMEAERLARLKRKRDPVTNDRAISPPPLRRSVLQSMPQRTRTAVARDGLTQAQKRQPIASTSPVSSRQPHLQYPHGKVLLTSQDASQEQSISLSQLLKPTESTALLKSALLSTFIVDFDWLLPHFDTRTVSFVLSLHAGNDQEKSLIQQDFIGVPNVRLVFPHVGGIVNCMHSKMMLLFYEDASGNGDKARCRIIIPSANLVPWDWGVQGLMENILFVIDLPSRKEVGTDLDDSSPRFRDNLIQMLGAMGTPGDVTKKLDVFDFSQTTKFDLVHTIGGSHIMSSTSRQPSIKDLMPLASGKLVPPTSAPTTTIRTGLVGLADTVRSLGLSISADDSAYPPKLDIVTSSLGNLKNKFLGSLFLAACGQSIDASTDLNKKFGLSVAQHKKTKTISPEAGAAVFIDNVRAYFPSEQTVRQSKGGPNSAGTICFQSKWWDGVNTTFPRDIVQDCVGTRGDGILMHSKIIFLRFASPKKALPGSLSPKSGTIENRKTWSASDNTAYAGWVYIGSANLSESAWGSFSTDVKTKQQKLNCRNWESGVLIPVPLKSELEGKNLYELSLQEIFGDVVPVPMIYPGIGLVESRRNPWFFHG